MNSLKGIFYGIVTSVTFGLIPLFTLPLMQKGMEFDSILFYRFLFATLALGGMMKLKKESFRIERRDIPMLILLGFFYTGSAMFLFWGYNFMGAGVATTLAFYLSDFCHFAYVPDFPGKSFVGYVAGHYSGHLWSQPAFSERNGTLTRSRWRGHCAAFCRCICQLHHGGQPFPRVRDIERTQAGILRIHRQYCSVCHKGWN